MLLMNMRMYKCIKFAYHLLTSDLDIDYVLHSAAVSHLECFIVIQHGCMLFSSRVYQAEIMLAFDIS